MASAPPNEEKREPRRSGRSEARIELEGSVELRAGVGEFVLLGEDGAEAVVEGGVVGILYGRSGEPCAWRSSGSPVASKGSGAGGGGRSGKANAGVSSC